MGETPNLEGVYKFKGKDYFVSIKPSSPPLESKYEECAKEMERSIIWHSIEGYNWGDVPNKKIKEILKKYF